ncbi:MAG: terpene cyclase/mutase family protein [Planctomycetes bacterium]|nr:terpene cyclase/mutase family protein [Planctomycetota bacterium]
MRRLIALGLLVPALMAVFVAPAVSQSKPKPKTKETRADEKVYSADDINRRIVASLEWFCDHQGPEGQWSAKDHDSHTLRVRAAHTHNLEWVKPGEEAGDTCDEGFDKGSDVPWTSLVLLCFLGSGHAHTDGAYKTYVAKGLSYLRLKQGSNGMIGDGECSCVHNHAVATMALCEAFALSADADLKPAAQKAVEYLLAAQSKESGWRYGFDDGQADTQMTGWCALAARSAQIAGLEGDFAKSWAGANKYLDSASADVQGTYRTGYMAGNAGGGSPRVRTAADWVSHPDSDAVNVTLRLLSGDKKWTPKSKELKGQTALMLKDLPVWADKKVDLAYLYFGTLGLHQMGDKKEFDAWKTPLLKALLENQRGWHAKDADTFEAVLDEFGSFDAIDAWRAWGGRVWTTAMATLCLQVVARYERLK